MAQINARNDKRIVVQLSNTTEERIVAVLDIIKGNDRPSPQSPFSEERAQNLDWFIETETSRLTVEEE